MATPFEKVYNAFLPQVKDYAIADLYRNNELAYKETMFDWLKNAIVNYPNPTVNLYDYNEDMEEFNVDLKPYEISILGKLMAIEYITPLILDETATKQSLNSKDYRNYSPQKHLDTLQKIKNEMNNEANRALSRQSYKVNNLEKLFGKKS